jgi:hypothetical protein
MQGFNQFVINIPFSAKATISHTRRDSINKTEKLLPEGFIAEGAYQQFQARRQHMAGQSVVDEPVFIRLVLFQGDKKHHPISGLGYLVFHFKLL